MNWTVYFSSRAKKQVKKLQDDDLLATIRYLAECLTNRGPFPGNEWPNYSKLKGKQDDLRHCHLLKGKPTYVSCWKVVDKQAKIIEVYYVGTHEKAPY